MQAKLTKQYLFPVVKGTSFGWAKIGHSIKSAFVNYIQEKGWIKISNYNNTGNNYLDQILLYRSSIQMFGTEYESCVKANKYLNKQYRRLAKALYSGNKIKYTKIFLLLMERSDNFLLAIFVNKIKFYTNNYSVNKVYHLKNQIRNIIKKNKNNLKFKRVFLKEYDSDGNFKKYRPLGVPDIKWRVIAAMYEMYLVNLLKPTWRENQYACMPKTGVVDAWIEILRNLHIYKGIIGIDLAKFFDTVYLWEVDRVLKKKGIPDEMLKRISEMNSRAPIIEPSQLELERERITKLEREAPICHLNINAPKTRIKALPQGLNTSPILACMVLNETEALKNYGEVIKHIQYVDDAIILTDIFPNVETAIEIYEEALDSDNTGIHLSKDKTEIIAKIVLDKENRGIRKWLKPLKFLGCEYDGQTFRANTRRGKIYEVRDAPTRIEEIIRWLQLNRNNVESYTRTKLSSLINESWNHSEKWMLLDPNKDLTRWEKYRIITTKILRNSVEDDVITRLRGSRMSMILGSTNVNSMLCAGTVLKGRKLTRRRSNPKFVNKHILEAHQMFRALPCRGNL